MLFEQRGTRRSGQAKKNEKFFGKHGILAHGDRDCVKLFLV